MYITVIILDITFSFLANLIRRVNLFMLVSNLTFQRTNFLDFLASQRNVCEYC